MFFNSSKFGLVSLVIVFVVETVAGHGMMMDPPNRSSLWRFDESAPINYNDNQNFCGGFAVQWDVYNGKCGQCGDSYGDSVPRANENTGIYGQGKVVAEYKPGQVVNVSILLTANHWGSFRYSLCVLNDPSQPETEECFQDLLLENGSAQFEVDVNTNYFANYVRLPDGLTCERCVLRWHYKTGNSWGECEDGTGAMGCGAQETFRSCSDISIV